MTASRLPLTDPAPLHHDRLVVAVLSSGSRGNCTYIGDGRHGVLIDCGLSTRNVVQRLAALGLGGPWGAPVDAVLITHEHTDHVGGAAILDRRLSTGRAEPLPFYLTRGTDQALDDRVRPRRVVHVHPGRPFQIGTLRIEPLSVPHDTREPVAYLVTSRGVRAGVITDLGRTSALVEQALGSLDIAVLEFNHDLEMLLDGAYPWSLKQRVRGPHGHLSNDQAQAILAAGATSRLRHVMLAHLSQDNNRPDKAIAAAERGLHQAGIRARIHVGLQYEASEPLSLDAAEEAAPPTRVDAQPRLFP